MAQQGVTTPSHATREVRGVTRTAEIYRLLFDSAREGDLSTIRSIFYPNPHATIANPNVDIDRMNRDDCTALMAAAHFGRYHVVAFLIENLHASVSARDRYGWSPLHHAARNGHANVVRLLLRHGADPTPRDANGCTALMLAAEAGHIAVVATLLRFQSTTPTDATVKSEEMSGSSRSLNDVAGGTRVSNNIESKVIWDLETRSSQGDTALTLACYGGHSDVALLLIDAGAQINSRGRKGRTPLMQAALRGHLDLVACLVYLGARLDLVDAHGLSVCDYENRSGGLLARALQRGISMLLLDAKAMAGTLALSVAKNPDNSLFGTAREAFPKLVELLGPQSSDSTATADAGLHTGDDNLGRSTVSISSAELSQDPDENPDTYNSSVETVKVQRLCKLTDFTKADLAYALLLPEANDALESATHAPAPHAASLEYATSGDSHDSSSQSGIQGIKLWQAIRAAASDVAATQSQQNLVESTVQSASATTATKLPAVPSQPDYNTLQFKRGAHYPISHQFPPPKQPTQPVLRIPLEDTSSHVESKPSKQQSYRYEDMVFRSDVDLDGIYYEMHEDEDEDEDEYEYEYEYEYEDEDEDGVESVNQELSAPEQLPKMPPGTQPTHTRASSSVLLPSRTSNGLLRGGNPSLSSHRSPSSMLTPPRHHNATKPYDDEKIPTRNGTASGSGLRSASNVESTEFSRTTIRSQSGNGRVITSSTTTSRISRNPFDEDIEGD